MKKYFVTGLVILLPIAVTVFVLAFIINFLTQPFIGLVSRFFAHFDIINRGFLFLTPEQLVRYGSQLIILVILFLVTVLLGMFARWFFFHTLLRLSDSVLHRIPIVNKVYKTSQEIIKTIFTSDKNSFKQVVMVAFPYPGIYMIGLIAREAPEACSRHLGQEMISVLIPTTPNPTTGFLVMFKKEELTYLDMRPEEAIKYIVSCGVIIPGSVPPKPTI